MHSDALLPATQQVMQKLGGASFLDNFYLSGGTALALHIGHRESEDLDFFTPDAFDPQHLQSAVEMVGRLIGVEIAEGTLNAFLDGVKLQFLHYPYRLLEPPVAWAGLSLSAVIDIACTKLLTISMRGSKKDFVDLYFLLQQYSLAELLAKVDQKYVNADYNRVHLAKSLLYFEDAEAQPMPRMIQKVSWEEVKAFITRAVKETQLFSPQSSAAKSTSTFGE